MPRSFNQKLKILYLMKAFEEKSPEFQLRASALQSRVPCGGWASAAPSGGCGGENC